MHLKFTTVTIKAEHVQAESYSPLEETLFDPQVLLSIFFTIC